MTEALQTPLSAEAVTIIQAGTPKPQTQAAVLPPQTAPKPVAPKPSTETVTLPKAKVTKDKPTEDQTLVPFNCRVPEDISQALLKASSERKLKRIQPFTQQSIIAEALVAWLQKNGYMPEKG